MPGDDFCDIALDQDAQKLYWVSCASHTIWRANTDGTVSEAVFTSDAVVSRLAVDHQGKKLYWTERDAGRIRRANLDGSDAETLLSGLTVPTGLALDFGQPVGLDAQSAQRPGATGLLAVNPSPVRERATVTFALAQAGGVTLEMYDVLGRRVALLASGAYGPGTHSVVWEAAGQGSGVYFCRLSSGSTTETVAVVLQR